MANPVLLHQRRKLLPRLSDYAKYRLLEMLPGILVWTTFAVALWLCFFRPLWAIAFIMVFDLYWLVRVFYLLMYLLMAYQRLQQSLKVHWLERCRQLPGWENLYHIIFLPTAGETFEVLKTSLFALQHAEYPKDRMLVVLATEGRFADQVRPIAERLRAEFGHVFRQFLVTEHPDNIPGEVKGKGSNIAWAGRKAKEWVDRELRVSYENILVSSFDVDTQAHPQYFSYLTCVFLSTPNRTHASYQPVPLFNNNIWQSPALMRVASNATTFWLMTEQIRPERLFTFSSHSMSFQTLVDVGFWQSDIVTEDSRIFLQGLLRYDGDYRVIPMYIPVSMDTVMAHSLWRSFVNLYKQQRRWAYGVENFPYMAWNFARNPLIPLRTKLRYIWNQLEGVYSWATAPILIFLFGQLPLRVSGDKLGNSIFAQNAPSLLQWLLTFAMVGLIVSAILSTTLLPPRPHGQPRVKILVIILQWILFPVSMIIFGSIPATDAQTRLMLGKYLGFYVTEKART